MNTLLIWASIGACGLGAVLAVIAIGWLLDRWASRPAELGGSHRALDRPLPHSGDVALWEATGSPRYAALATLDGTGGGNVLAPSPVQVIRPLGYEQERTEEQRLVEETPVEHVGAVEDWSPTAELSLVPPRSLDPDAAADEDLRDELDRIEATARAGIARAGQREMHTCEWTAEEFAALLATAGAR